MAYRQLSPDNDADQKLVKELEPYLVNRMPDEPIPAFKAWRMGFCNSEIDTVTQDPANRSVDGAWEVLFGDADLSPEDLEAWTEWEKKFRWEERGMVLDFISTRTPEVTKGE